MAHRTGSKRALGFGLVVAGLRAVHRGDLLAATNALEEILGTVGDGRHEDRHVFALVELLESLIDLVAGRPALAVERLRSQPRTFVILRPVLLQLSGAAHVALGEPDAARRLVEGRADSGPWAAAMGDWVLGLAARPSAEGAAQLRSAAEALDGLGFRLHAAMAWVDWAGAVPASDGGVEVVAVLGERLAPRPA